MGRGDSQLNSDDALNAAEAETRRLLARYGQPSYVDPPADLADRVLRVINTPPPSRPDSQFRRLSGWVILVGFIALIAYGSWGVLLDSSGPARLFGDLNGGLSQIILLLTLTAKPLINLLLTAGVATFIVLLALVGGGWFWWLLLRQELAPLSEAGV
ncbi:MAG: hypothetical protein HGA19_00950 [Oscillochloris sp.]|nr:hypothetical protein [Oscillochloris sp.]